MKCAVRRRPFHGDEGMPGLTNWLSMAMPERMYRDWDGASQQQVSKWF
jgi:hypothetical protein